MNTKPTPEAIATLRTLTTPEQYEVITDAMMGEEGDAFIEIIDRIHAAWQAMPKTYETDGQGCAALARIHYFTGGCDWWIVEKDSDPDHVGQVQAFGIADLGMVSPGTSKPATYGQIKTSHFSFVVETMIPHFPRGVTTARRKIA